jgi:plasmid stability protein
LWVREIFGGGGAVFPFGETFKREMGFFSTVFPKGSDSVTDKSLIVFFDFMRRHPQFFNMAMLSTSILLLTDLSLLHGAEFISSNLAGFNRLSQPPPIICVASSPIFFVIFAVAVNVCTITPPYAIIMITRRHAMANLLIRDIPDDVVAELKQRAKAHNRPLQRELKGILLETARRPCGDISQRAAEIRLKLSGEHRLFTDSAALLREDRDR